MSNDSQQSTVMTSNEMTREWRCFHCDEVFTDREAAADHFGVQIDGCADDVACKLNAEEGQLVKMLREAHAELRQYHQENNAAFREYYSLGAAHSTALRQEEEKGYARGLRDARAEISQSETSGRVGCTCYPEDDPHALECPVRQLAERSALKSRGEY